MFQVPESGAPKSQISVGDNSIELLLKHCTSERRPAQNGFSFEEAVEFRDKFSQAVDELGEKLDSAARKGAA